MLFFSSLFLNIFDFGAGAVIFGAKNYQLIGFGGFILTPWGSTLAPWGSPGRP
jgi:hypothetical protein